MVGNALQAVLMVLLIMAFGYFAGWRGWATKSVTLFLSKLIVNITMPCTAVVVFLDNFTADTLHESLLYVGASVLAIMVVYVVAKLVIRLAKIDKKKRGVFTALFSFSNSMFIGLPVALAIFGGKGVLFAMFYYIANTVMMNSIGFVEIGRDGMEIAGGTENRVAGKQIVRQVFQPPIIGVAIGIVLVLLGVKLPNFLGDALRYTGNITSPLALIFVGIILQRTGLSCVRRMNKEVGLSLIGRFILSPLVMFAVAMLFGLPTFATQVLVVQVGLPAMVSTAIFAERAGADTELAAQGIAVTTLLSFITIPVSIAIFGAM